MNAIFCSSLLLLRNHAFESDILAYWTQNSHETLFYLYYFKFRSYLIICDSTKVHLKR